MNTHLVIIPHQKIPGSNLFLKQQENHSVGYGIGKNIQVKTGMRVRCALGMTSPQPRTSVLGFSGSKARVPVSVPKLNLYAFTLFFSSLVANKKYMHVPNPRLTESRDYSVNALGTFLQKLNLI